MEVGVGAVDLDRLVPDHRVRAGDRLPVELAEARLARGVDEPEGVHAEALHHPVAARDRAVRHHPHQHVRRLGHQRDEVPERVVRRRRLRHRVVRLGLDGVDEVGELHRVLDEEHRDVVADDVPVAFVGVELDGEAAHVARQVERAALAGDGREAHEHRRALAGLGERRRARDRRQVLVALEVAVRRRAARVDDPLGDALVVEVGDLLAEDEVFHQRRPAQAGLERVLVVGDGDAHVGRQRLAARVDADAVERLVAGVVALRRLAAADLGRASRPRSPCWRRRSGRAARPAGPAAARGRGEAVLAGLERIRRHRRGGRLGADLLRRQALLRRACRAGRRRLAPARRSTGRRRSPARCRRLP